MKTKEKKKKPVMFRDIPVRLHIRFKMKCVEEGISMSKKITDLIRGYLNDGKE